MEKWSPFLFVRSQWSLDAWLALCPVEASHRSGAGQLKTISVRARKRTGAVHIRTFTVRAWRTDRFGPLSRRNYAREEQKFNRSPHRIKEVSCKPIKKPGRAQIRSAVVSSPKPCGQGCSCSANNTASPCTHITFLLCCPWGLPLFLTIKFTRWLWSCKRSSQRTDHSVVLLR